jgi:magnesium chelatase family protein
VALAVLNSRALAGLAAPEVTVEVHLVAGLPAFTLVGLPDTEVKEARDRVRAIGQLSLSAGGYHRILKVARSVTDLAGESQIRSVHIAEAVCYRLLLRGA